MSKASERFIDFKVSSDDFTFENNSYFIKKWNWDYKECHEFQKFCVSIVQEDPKIKFFIACNHPRVLTHGRGLQKPKKGEVLNLIDFDFSLLEKTDLPFYKIERGGGLTFHHPGQFIFYPIIKLNPNQLSLSKMTSEIFQFSSEILKSWGMTNLSSENKLMGLWKDEFKIASMGIAISKLVTFHGMALNIFSDEYFKNILKIMNPCGLNSEIYKSVSDFILPPEDALNIFALSFFERIKNEWQ
jgi:lipoyl(octanoyl) transferase